MRRYRFALCDVDGRIVDSRESACADDLDALDHAVELWKRYIVEIRESGTFVARVKPGDRPLDETDRTSLVYPSDVLRPRAQDAASPSAMECKTPEKSSAD